MAAGDIRVGDELSIPSSEFRLETTRSSGPGGQHVNKTETRVTLVFDLDGSKSLTPEQVALVRRRLDSRITKQGEIRISSQSHRSQKANREEAVERFADLLLDAITPLPERKATRLPAAAKRRRLDEKKRVSGRKRDRGKIDWD